MDTKKFDFSDVISSAEMLRACDTLLRTSLGIVLHLDSFGVAPIGENKKDFDRCIKAFETVSRFCSSSALSLYKKADSLKSVSSSTQKTSSDA